MNAKSIRCLFTLAILTWANWTSAADRIIGVQSAWVSYKKREDWRV